MTEPGTTELNVTNQTTETVRTNSDEKLQGKIGRFFAAIRRPFGRGESDSKKQEAPTPQPNLDELKQDEANLNQIMSKGGKDFRNPADANTLREIRNKIAAIEGQQTSPTPLETPVPGITKIPLENQPIQQPTEEVKAA